MSQPEDLTGDLLRAFRPVLEKCTCGQHFDCPYGWHRDEELPCACTPDCRLDERCDYCGAWFDGEGTCLGCGRKP